MKIVGFCIFVALTSSSYARQIPPSKNIGSDTITQDATSEDKSRKPVESLVVFEKYYTPQGIEDYLHQLTEMYPDMTRLERVGTSVEGRPLNALHISSQPDPDKPIVFIDAGIHAREWIAPAAALYIINQLVENYTANSQTTDAVDWIIFPMVNPDGYDYSITKDRLWRKNRANTTIPQCSGVDLNRNFDMVFGGLGTSNDPCEEIYAGPHAFSEPESRAIRDIALKHKGKIKLYLTLHSYGKFFLYPWGYDYLLPKDWKELQSLASKAAKAVSSVYGTKYRIGSSGVLMGAAAGGSDDWVKEKGGVKYSYTVELPGGGQEGFDLPEKMIKPAVTEFYPAIEVFVAHIAAKYNQSSPKE